MASHIVLLLFSFLMCESRPMKNQSESVEIPLPNHVRNHTITQNNIKLTKQNNRRQLGPIYIDSEEFEYDSLPFGFHHDVPETPSQTYAPPFFDSKEELDSITSHKNFELSAPSSFESVSYATIVEDTFITKFQPNKELIEIAESHIKKLDSSDKSKSEETKSRVVYNSTHTKHENDPRSSYRAPLSSVFGNITNSKNIPKSGPPATSYGIPDLKATPYPPYHFSIPNVIFEEDQSKENITEGPPSRSYGVPDQKIHVDSIKKNNDKVTASSDNLINEGSKNGIKTSYGVPLNSVLALPNITEHSIESIGIPDKQIDTVFNNFIKPLSNETIYETTEDYISITTDLTTTNESDDNCCEVEIFKSLSSFYDLEDDGRLLNRDHLD